MNKLVLFLFLNNDLPRKIKKITSLTEDSYEILLECDFLIVVGRYFQDWKLYLKNISKYINRKYQIIRRKKNKQIKVAFLFEKYRKLVLGLEVINRKKKTIKGLFSVSPYFMTIITFVYSSLLKVQSFVYSLLQ